MATTPVISGTATRPDMRPMALLPTAMAIRAVAMGSLVSLAERQGRAWLTAGFIADWASIYLSRVSATFTPAFESEARQ